MAVDSLRESRPRQHGLKEPGVGSDRTNGKQKSRWILMSAVGVVELPGDCLTSIHTPDPSGLPHRHCLEQSGESGLNPIPHSGCARLGYMGVLDPVTDGLGRWTP
ncbi:hypothetical protein CRG98_047308 [Punica granatum]|uniref:Uncharacterized protein n=1 Tax=Punica granatum TaxID=22663 RepID=A0A2I0HKQ0_PUNGR|nr:hypothetical protein CRG98_047308 [Punica granatum]